MSLNIIDCESLENFRENIIDGTYFSKVARLQCKSSNSTLSRLYQRFSSEYAPKISCLKKNDLRKKSTVYQLFSKVVTLSCTARSFTKNGTHVRYFGRRAEKI